MVGASVNGVHPQATVDLALALRAGGLDATEIGRSLGVPKSTIQYWCRGGRRPADPRAEPPVCPRCHEFPLDEFRYAHLLGHYLGDGHISISRRSVPCLSIYCADDWLGVRAEVMASMSAVMTASKVHLVARTGCHAVKSYTKHWLCLFPQHGAGPKHARPIALEPWQQEIVEREPDRLLRGLFHSDGCRITNWTEKQTESGTKRYEYPRYFFSNKSTDILGIATTALDRLGVAYRRPRWDLVSVARREAVARLDEFVGPKY
ncbi:hypothetical protein [Actinomycetospora sp. NBRC 106375]|uniref:hypothetical protein n=1 Tax=Actinomycetospora sp. NBRC 106375 TaxID=3032207 RepID=UPI002552CD8D|nr:hypothetical protein [Actinomycetospora sp. NBRC 106375]